MPCATPVVFLIFRRPDLTARVFEAIRQAQPKILLVVADGPRNEVEAELCQQARAVTEQVDWDCEVIRRYSNSNLGCGKNVSQGITWAFEKVEEAIILEDDCLPHSSFFLFCDELLKEYRYDERVMQISGTNLLGKWESNTQSYHFSQYGGIWGWASWKRAWSFYDYNLELWADEKIKSSIHDILVKKQQVPTWYRAFCETYSGEIDTWDYQWLFARLIQSGLSIVPSVNLVANLGFREDATHTKNRESIYAQLKHSEITFPLKKRLVTMVDYDYDQQSQLVPTSSPKSIIGTTAFLKIKLKAILQKYFKPLRNQNVVKRLRLDKAKYGLSIFLRNVIQYSELLERRILLDKSIQLDPSAKIFPEAKITNLAEDSNLIRVNKDSVVRGELLVFAHDGKISIGTDCYIGEGTRIWSSSSIQIGDRVFISHNVNIHDTNSHSTNSQLRYLHFRHIMSSGHPRTDDYDIKSAPIWIDSDVWIGFNSTVLKGVKIGKGSIVAACSVVTKDVPEYVLVAGNPAKVVKNLEIDLKDELAKESK
ncbi:acyltransferase [Nodosilinea sp. FACHB-131]|uniref:acyltransferase n=1 Tax=Cyanophyceae TaxID=3028117 RepID=UPI0016865D00|nr:acyltransferase [Nodosilinea sp. FACHB-131]MBD1874002.1 acyltransferase [Nodosilinea sp. FACHB-131]